MFNAVSGWREAYDEELADHPGNDKALEESLLLLASIWRIIGIVWMVCSFIEAIKCHHNEIANYIKENLIKNFNENDISHYFHFYNYLCFRESFLNHEKTFFDLWEYDNLTLVKLLLQTKKIDLKATIILKIIIFFFIKFYIQLFF